MNYRQKYDEVLEFIRLQGISVYHISMAKNLAGAFDCSTKSIEIETDLRRSKEGLEVLAHEYCHLVQYENGEFAEFFKMTDKFSEDKFKLVVKAEKDCAKKTQKFLAQFGIKYRAEELNPKHRKEFMDFWRDYYFG